MNGSSDMVKIGAGGCGSREELQRPGKRKCLESHTVDGDSPVRESPRPSVTICSPE